jgi:hypothetical protein
MAGYQDTIYNLFKDSSIFNKFGKEEEELKRLYNTNPNYKVSPSYGEAKGANLMNIKGFGPVPGVYDWVNNAIGGLQTAALGGGNLLYQALTEDNILNAIPAAWEQTKGYAQQRFDNNYGTSAQEMFDRAKVLENNNNPVNTNVFNAGTIDVEDYSTKQQRVQAERAAQAQAQAAAKQQQILADQTRMQQGQTSTPVLPAPVKQTVMNTPSNQTKFGANRSTAIKGGRGGRGNYSKPVAKSPSPVFKSYGPPNMQRFR